MARYFFRTDFGETKMIERVHDIDAIVYAYQSGYSEVWRIKTGGERLLVYRRGVKGDDVYV